MMKNYIALLFGATLLYGCGGEYSFVPNTPTDPADMDSQQSPLLEQIGQGNPANYMTRNIDAYFVFTEKTSGRFMQVWMEGFASPEQEFDLEENQALAVVVSNDLPNYALEIDTLTYGEGFTQLNVHEQENVYGSGDKSPYAIAKFDHPGGEVHFTRSDENGGQKFNTQYPTYQDLVEQELGMRLTQEGAYYPIEADHSARLKLDSATCPEGEQEHFLEVAELSMQNEKGEAGPDRALFCTKHGYLWTRESANFYGPMTPGVFFQETEGPK